MEGISVIVPFLNESDVIALFCEELDTYAGSIAFPLELVFVDDGSSDNTNLLIQNHHFKNIKKVKLITLSKNFGSHAAIRAGLSYATYDICTWMGSDLQEPIEFLELAFQRIINGYDVVYIEKKEISISKFERVFSNIYSAMMRRFAVKNYSSGGTSNIVFNKKVKAFLNENIENNSSIMLQIIDVGFISTTLSLNYKNRAAGVSKWTLSKKIKLLIDSFVSFSFLPIRLVSVIGIAMFALGILFGFYIIINKLIHPVNPIPGYSTIASLLAIGFGITNISLGIIAEYLWRAYDASRGRPVFVISEMSELK
ncbi:MAG: hypothetical protein K0R54_1671 [Clostridiaceae bacterium]|jgi:dolichol-phosphate mannosyltransferase|nr:hypothetical protein [Clostridiaceae bacterium]